MKASRVPTKRQSLFKQLDILADQMTPEIRAAFLGAIQGVRDNAILSEIIKAIEAGDLNRAFDAVGFSEAAMRPITAAIEKAFEAGGVTTADTFPALLNPTTGARSVFRFDIRNSRAETWLRDRSSGLVTRLTEEARGAARDTLQRGMIDGRNPRNVALDIVGRIDPITQTRVGGIIGLSAPQERYVANAKIELSSPATADNWFTRQRRDQRFDKIVQKSIDTGTPLDSETIQKLTTRYSDSLLQLRGETIGRTEAIQALNQSSHEAFAQAVDSGAIPRSAVKRVWDATGDSRTRPDHMAMDGQTVGMDEPFKAPDGSQLMFPGDQSLGADPEETINCRCRVRMAVDWLAGAGG